MKDVNSDNRKDCSLRGYTILRTVPPFVTAPTFCAYRVCSEIFGFLRNLPTNTMVLNDYVGKADLSKGYQNPPKKLGSLHFSEVIELKFEKKMPYILCILKLFRIMVIISEKCRVTHIFLSISNGSR